MPDVSVQGRLGNVISGILMHGPSPVTRLHLITNTALWARIRTKVQENPTGLLSRSYPKLGHSAVALDTKHIGQLTGDLTPLRSGHNPAPGINHYWLHNPNFPLLFNSYSLQLSCLLLLSHFSFSAELNPEWWHSIKALRSQSSGCFYASALYLYPMCTLVTSRRIHSISISDHATSEV